MDDQFKHKYRVSSARMPCWDYGSHGLYYITICTKDRINYFGEIVSGYDAETQGLETQNLASLRKKISGHTVETQDVASPPETIQEHTVETQDFASPRETIQGHDAETQDSETQNLETQHLASLRKTVIGEIAYNNWLDIPNHFPFIELDEFVVMPNHMHGILFINRPDKIDWQANKFGSQSRNLASVIRGYKSSVKTYATINTTEFHWQPRYYDRVIRDEKEYLNVREYIINNPAQWLLNGDNEKDLY